jgi:hypothetical protein
MFYVLNGTGGWEIEPSPSNREDAFLERCRFTEEEALSLANDAVNAVIVNGRTIAQAQVYVDSMRVRS